MYHLAQNNEKTGPFTLEQVREKWRVGALSPQTLYWEEGMTEWQPLERIAASLLAPGATLAPAGPAAFPTPTADPLSPVATSHEPSAYDLPASRLPPAPVSALPTPTRADALSLFATPPVPAPAPAVGSSPLIAPTRLPPSGTGGIVPVGSAYPATAGASFPTPMMPPGPPQTPTAAYLSLGFALLGPILVLIPVVGWLVGGLLIVVAIICGHAARAEIKQSGGRLPGKGIATTGLIFAYLGVVFAVLLILSIILLFGYAILHGGTYPTRAHH